ncbi:hypothetical protein HYC85_018831 [Camellia sinensis]|uniref:Uncharacterized protein n=1 Tax=Camellia sinensis TaxID=4442 RepID=A0A7J7GZ30_CAMSI|nr:hypothetical protein HYC85_018831 [Camellia sinensis]
MNNEQRKSEKMVDEKYTRPQGLYQDRDVDHKKLRKLILDSKLAPCYPGDEECGFDLEECPICFLSQLLKMLHERHLYRVFSADEDPEFDSAYSWSIVGVKTKEEKGIEQIEEQRVIEAKIRMRQQ